MVTPSKGLLKKPARSGFMGPLSILKVAEATEVLCGTDTRDELLKAAQIFRLPAEDEPVREQKVAALHKTVRTMLDADAVAILSLAGRKTADYVMDYRMSRRAQTMLRAMPWPTASWLLGQSFAQNAWTLAGSGVFEIVGRMDFRLTSNPAIKGETASEPICHYHRAQFERLFQALVHDSLVCTEISCAAAGDEYCQFALRAASD